MDNGKPAAKIFEIILEMEKKRIKEGKEKKQQGSCFWTLPKGKCLILILFLAKL
jgi:hypothetical protein